MIRPRMCASRLLLAPILMTAAAAHGDDADVIDYRRHVMKTMGEQAAIIGMILEKRAPADDLATHAKVLAITAQTAKSAFEPEVPGGEAKAEVWAQWSDFSKRLDELVVAADAVAEAAQGGPSAVEAKIKTLPCKNCHDTYREEKKEKQTE
jgi:cytochrome c556